MENKWESYGDVNPLEYGGVWARQDKDNKNCFTVITLDIYDNDEENETYQFTSSYVDIADDWIDWEAVSGFTGEDREKYASDVISYYGAWQVGGCIQIIKIDKVMEFLSDYGIKI